MEQKISGWLVAFVVLCLFASFGLQGCSDPDDDGYFNYSDFE